MQYENTHVYARTRTLVRLCRQVLESLPTGYGFVADQMRRASSSILLNFAEGYGKGSPPEARRYFHIARGSANEVAAIFDVAHDFGVLNGANYSAGKDPCNQLARMLSRFRQ